MDLFAKYHTEYPIEALSDNDYKKLLKLKDGDFIKVEKWMERNINFHRKYFSLLNCCINHMPEDDRFDRFRNVDSLRREIMYQTGRYDVHETLGGKMSYISHSISFRSMDDEEFSKVYSEALDIILKHFLKGISKEDFENDILNFL